MFDYEYGDGTPAKYDNFISIGKPSVIGTWVDYGAATSKDSTTACEIEITDGQLLHSKSQMINQKSCVPHSYNTGNYYNFPAAATRTSEPASGSICPKGWSLPENGSKAGYSRFLLEYGIDYNATSRTSPDSGLINQPLAFLYCGSYNVTGILDRRGNDGDYRMTSQRLFFNRANLNPADSTLGNYGYSVRCVVR